jgi:hypothetical protein
MEQQVNVKFCYKLGKMATETREMLVQVYGTKAVSRKCVYDWFKRFCDGKETTEDEPRSGQPSADPNVAINSYTNYEGTHTKILMTMANVVWYSQSK